jgi:hypothetical protein
MFTPEHGRIKLHLDTTQKIVLFIVIAMTSANPVQMKSNVVDAD